MAFVSRKRSKPSMATVPRPHPKTRVEQLRERSQDVDHSVAGDPKKRAAQQLKVLKNWRTLRNKAGK
jgi:hypothetical protein